MILIIYLICSNLCAITEDLRFYKVVKKLEKNHYFIRNNSECNSITSNSKYCILSNNSDCLLNELLCIEAFKNGLDIVLNRSLYIKSNILKNNKIYSRATIKEWSFRDTTSAKNVFNFINLHGFDDLSPCTNKSPYAILYDKKCIYFIIIGGHFMISELPKLKKAFLTNLNSI